MRTILTLLIVFMHAFTCYQGGWPQPDGYIDIPVYNWIAKTSFAFTLEAFVFISGYLFAFQRISLHRINGFVDLITNKLRRLIIPSVVFSALYYPLFFEYKGIIDFIYSLINGSGHMWFLPMLFWCFVGGWLLEQIKIGDGWKMVLLVCLNLISFYSLPLQISKAATYLFYFYGGYIVYKYSDSIMALIKTNHIILCWIVFLVLFVSLRPWKDTFEIQAFSSFANGLMTQCVRRVCLLIYASLGTLAFYITAAYYVSHHQLKAFTTKLASCCFGIYLFQQFILKALYYKTGFAEAVGPYWLPWFGFLIAAPLSYFMTVLLLKTRIGRFLIG